MALMWLCTLCFFIRSIVTPSTIPAPADRILPLPDAVCGNVVLCHHVPLVVSKWECRRGRATIEDEVLLHRISLGHEQMDGLGHPICTMRAEHCFGNHKMTNHEMLKYGQVPRHNSCSASKHFTSHTKLPARRTLLERYILPLSIPHRFIRTGYQDYIVHAGNFLTPETGDLSTVNFRNPEITWMNPEPMDLATTAFVDFQTSGS